MISSLPESEHRTVKLSGLNDMVKFCTKSECRKIQLRKYFKQETCCKKCDFCTAGICVEKTVANAEAIEIITCLQSLQELHDKITLNTLLLVYRGSKRKEILNKSFHTIPEYGKGKGKFFDNGLMHFVQMLISENVITEKLRGTNESGSTPYLVAGNQLQSLTHGELEVYKYKKLTLNSLMTNAS